MGDTQPAFDDERFTKHLAREMHAFRGRELPGFTNSQVFYGFMVKNIEEWRPFVEDCRRSMSLRLFESVMSCWRLSHLPTRHWSLKYDN